uniref:Uncharacterized protein n=1 Tax=Zooxanthella nutricula TaxID=1333877 RepID=A0A6U6ULN5_9DINO|mmetsp:Transcript_8529/g.25330  ORF Transcript_8529/g.25330 Transcript_8529/m.25330 type:complete len:460 (+) Transcript_8529:103-1482(+)
MICALTIAVLAHRVSARALAVLEQTPVVKPSKSIWRPMVQARLPSATEDCSELARAGSLMQQTADGSSEANTALDDLWRAIRDKNMTVVRKILSEATDSPRKLVELLDTYAFDHTPNRGTSCGEHSELQLTPLMWASEHNQPELAEALLGRGVVDCLEGARLTDVLTRRHGGEFSSHATALGIAARLGHKEVVRNMLSRHVLEALPGARGVGKFLAAQDKTGRTGLIRAVEGGSVEIVRMILGEDVLEALDAARLRDLLLRESKEGWGAIRTALTDAAERGNSNFVQALLAPAVLGRLGPDMFRDVFAARVPRAALGRQRPHSALMHAAKGGHSTVVRQLLAPDVLSRLGEHAQEVLQQLFEEDTVEDARTQHMLDTGTEEEKAMIDRRTVLQCLKGMHGLGARLEELVKRARGVVTKELVEWYILVEARHICGAAIVGTSAIIGVLVGAVMVYLWQLR